jgi:amino-acid N-acetyltransferase
MIRKANLSDVKAIQKLINGYAEERRMLSRSLNHLYEHIREFFVYEDEAGEIKGCCASHITWDNLAEIKALAVSKDAGQKGVGRMLVEKCIEDSKAIGVSQIFALTYVDGFFVKLGFKIINRDDLPHKVWRECIHCPKFPDCDEIAVIKEV